MKDPSKLLKRIRRQKEQALAAVQLLSDQERLIHAQEAYRKSPDYRRLEREIRTVKRAIQISRLNIVRKEFAIKTRNRQIEKLEQLIGSYKEALTTQLDRLRELTTAADDIRHLHKSETAAVQVGGPGPQVE